MLGKRKNWAVEVLYLGQACGIYLFFLKCFINTISTEGLNALVDAKPCASFPSMEAYGF
jgi:hypothetical protein